VQDGFFIAEMFMREQQPTSAACQQGQQSRAKRMAAAFADLPAEPFPIRGRLFS
jgi:hypothetical protein